LHPLLSQDKKGKIGIRSIFKKRKRKKAIEVKANNESARQKARGLKRYTFNKNV